MRPAIPYEVPNARPGGSHHWTGEAKRWTRKLAEAGKLSSPGKRLPLYRMKPEPPEDVA